MEEEHFSYGYPVWIVYVKDGEELLWKGLFGYTGSYITLVPGQQEYKAYTLREYSFTAYADDVLGNDKRELAKKTSARIISVQRGQVGHDEAVEILKTLVPLYKEWKRTHQRGDSEIEGFIDEYGWMAGF